MKQELPGSRILVTGADGFIRSHLADRMLDEGAAAAFCAYHSNEASGCASLGAVSAMIVPAEPSLAGNKAPYRREGFGRGCYTVADTLAKRFEHEQARVVDALVDFSS